MQLNMQIVWTLGTLMSLIVAVLLWRNRCPVHLSETAKLPALLRDGRLVYAERLFRSVEFNGGWVVSARVDRAYGIPSVQGLLVLVELKTRAADKVHLSDLIELSAQRFAMESGGREQVSEKAFVLVKSSRHPTGRFHEVKLMPHESIMALAGRRERLLAGFELPRSSRNEHLCDGCSFRTGCHRRAGV